jgi:hypothetical protein
MDAAHCEANAMRGIFCPPGHCSPPDLQGLVRLMMTAKKLCKDLWIESFYTETRKSLVEAPEL